MSTNKYPTSTTIINHMLTSRLDMQFHTVFLTALYHQGISQTRVPGHHHTSPHGGHIPHSMSPIAHNYKPRGRAGPSSWAVLTQKRGFSPLNPKSGHSQPKSCLYNTPTHLITFYNIKPLPKLKIDDQLIINLSNFI